jgi:hypothetical protein
MIIVALIAVGLLVWAGATLIIDGWLWRALVPT